MNTTEKQDLRPASVNQRAFINATTARFHEGLTGMLATEASDTFALDIPITDIPEMAEAAKKLGLVDTELTLAVLVRPKSQMAPFLEFLNQIRSGEVIEG